MKRSHDTAIKGVGGGGGGGVELTPPQQEAFKAVTNLRNPEHVLLTGEAGAGKSVVAHAAIKRILQNAGDASLIVAGSTGIAALEIGGATLDRHMGWKIHGGTADFEWLQTFAEEMAEATRWPKKGTQHDPKKSNLYWVKEAMQKARAMLIDEVSMLTARKVDNLDVVLRRVRNQPRKPFGGLKLIFVGDFFQLPPVLGKQEVDTYDPEYYFAFQSKVWKEAKVRMLYLPGSLRQKDDILYAALLSRARIGALTEADIALLKTRVLPPPSADSGRVVTYLFPHNREADAKNRACLDALGTPLRTFEAVDSFSKPALKDANLFKDVRAIQMIELKEGAVVMLLRNMTRMDFLSVNVTLPEDAGVDLTTDRGKQKETILANGSTGRVVRFGRIAGEDVACPIVRFVRKHGKGAVEVPIKVHQFDIPGANPREGPIAARIQLPLLLCYAISAHKSQGQTIDAPVVPDLVHCFQAGMAYVMLSRVKTIEDLYLPNFDPGVFKADPRVLAFHQECMGQALKTSF
jgi:ATP-dependent DNA helicase PIF1